MRKTIRRIGSLLLCAVLFLACNVMPAAALPAGVTESGTKDGISWSTQGNTLTFSGEGYVEGLTHFGDLPPWGNWEIHHVVVEDGIWGIGYGAFKRCTELKTISFPVSATYIGVDCFLIESLTDVYYAGSQAQWNQIDTIVNWPEGVKLHCAVSASSGWYRTGGFWHYSRDGVDVTGWLKLDGLTYYMDETGVMQTGWQKIDGKWYYLDNSGVLQRGWKKLAGTWYYLLSDGAMADRDRIVDGRLCQFDANGAWLGYAAAGFYTNQKGETYYIKKDGTAATGWLQINGQWYYFQKTGVMHTGWLQLGKTWYYLKPANGAMATGWQKQNGSWYFFQADGSMKTGWTKQNGTWYYLHSSGAAATGITKIGGSSYIFDENCGMRTGLIQLQAEGGRTLTYYATQSGALATGWTQIGENWHHFYRDGHMARNTYIESYYIGSDGVPEFFLQTNVLMDVHYGSTPQQAAQAEALTKEIAADALKNGGKTEFEKVCYAVEKVRDRYWTSRTRNAEMGVYESIYGPLFLETSGNHSDRLAIGRVLDHMGIAWYLGYSARDEKIYVKMDGEFGWVDIWSEEVSYGNPEDLDRYFPEPDIAANTPGTWVKEQGNWYFRDTQGKKRTGWLRTGNVQYYLGSDGKMATGWKKIDGSWYYFDGNGGMCKGVVSVGGKDYWFGNDGKMATGWFRSYRNELFYADANGVMAKGWKVVDGKYYYFYKDGHLAQETFIDNHYVNADGVWESSVAVKQEHNHYKYLTADQGAQADAVARAIAQEAMEKGGATDLEKVSYAARLVMAYVKSCRYQNDENRYYRSPYGVFVAGVYTCAGSTRAMGRVLEFMGFDWYHIGEDQWSHQWVCVKMDGEYGWVEPQLGEAGYGNFRQSYIPRS